MLKDLNIAGSFCAYRDFAKTVSALVNQRVHNAKMKVVKENIAKDKGLTQLLRLCPRQKDGLASSPTLRSAIDALLGAVFVDSGECLGTVKNVALRLG